MKIIAATHAQPIKKPITDVRDGIAISRFVFGKMFRFSGTIAPSGKVQGIDTCSPGVIGVRISA